METVEEERLDMCFLLLVVRSETKPRDLKQPIFYVSVSKTKYNEMQGNFERIQIKN